jgi:hypothetical protein
MLIETGMLALSHHQHVVITLVGSYYLWNVQSISN